VEGVSKHRSSMDKRRVDVAYLITVFILIVAASAPSGKLLFKLYDRAVQLYDVTGDERGVRLVKLGIAMWLIFVLSSGCWLIAVIWEDRGEEGWAYYAVGHSCDSQREAGGNLARWEIRGLPGKSRS